MAKFSTQEEAIGGYNYLAVLQDNTWTDAWRHETGGKCAKYIAYMKKEGRRPSLKIVRWQTRNRGLDADGRKCYPEQTIDAWKFFPNFWRHKGSIFELRQKYFDWMKNRIELIEVTEGV